MITSPLYDCLVCQRHRTGTTVHLLKASSTSESSSYGDTQSGVKVIIQGLTSLSNLFLPKGPTAARVYKKATLTPLEVVDGVIGDFENGYLFSGQIDSEIYDEDCVFTDPTLSFKGLSTFERNIKALKPALDIFVGDSIVVLYDCKINQELKEIKAIWRMSGAVNLPWRPRIELTGNTVLSYDTDRGGRIVDYYERWDLPAATALLQLLQPAKKMTEKTVLVGATEIISTEGESSVSQRAATETINIKKLKTDITKYASNKVSKISENFVVDSNIADAVSQLIKGSSKEYLVPQNEMTAEQAGVEALQLLQNSYEILYTSVKSEKIEENPIEMFLTKIQNSFPEIEFTDLSNSEGVLKSLLTVGPFSIQIAASCIQPDPLKASILISQKRLKVI